MARAWDLAAVHRLLFGGFGAEPARVWARLHDRTAASIPALGQLGLLDEHGDEGDDPGATRNDPMAISGRSGRPAGGASARPPGHLGRDGADGRAVLQQERLRALTAHPPMATGTFGIRRGTADHRAERRRTAPRPLGAVGAARRGDRTAPTRRRRGHRATRAARRRRSRARAARRRPRPAQSGARALVAPSGRCRRRRHTCVASGTVARHPSLRRCPAALAQGRAVGDHLRIRLVGSARRAGRPAAGSVDGVRTAPPDG